MRICKPRRFRLSVKRSFALQYFELLLAPVYAIHKHVIKGNDELLPTYAKDANFKQPLTAVVKELEDAGRIDAALAKSLRDYSEQRHILVHRWILQKGYLTNDGSFKALAEHAVMVFEQTQALITAIVEYSTKYGPEGEVDVDDYNKRMQSIFKDLKF